MPPTNPLAPPMPPTEAPLLPRSLSSRVRTAPVLGSSTLTPPLFPLFLDTPLRFKPWDRCVRSVADLVASLCPSEAATLVGDPYLPLLRGSHPCFPELPSPSGFA